MVTASRRSIAMIMSRWYILVYWLIKWLWRVRWSVCVCVCVCVCLCVCVCVCVCVRACAYMQAYTQRYTCTTDIHIRTCMGIHYVYVLPRLCASTTTISQIYNTMGPPLSPFPTCLKLNRYILFRIDQPVFYKDEWLNIGRICHHKWHHVGSHVQLPNIPLTGIQ